MASSNTVAVVFKEVALALKPLATAPAAADPNQLPEVFTIALDGMGVALDRALGPDTVRTVVNAIGKITKAYQAIEPILARQTAPDLAEANVIAARLGDAFAGLAELSALKLKANLGEGLVELENVGRLLLEYLIAEHLWENHFTIFNVLALFGAIELGDPRSTDLERRLTRLNVSQLAAFVADASAGAQQLYGWGAPDFRPDRLLAPLGFLLQDVGFTARFGYPSDQDALLLGWAAAGKRPQMQLLIPLIGGTAGSASLEAGFAIVPVSKTASKAAGLAVVPYGLGQSSQRFDAGDGWELDYRVTGGVQGRYGLVVRFNEIGIQSLDGSSGPTSYDVRAGATLTRFAHDSGRIVLIGQSDIAAVEAGGIGVGLGLQFKDGDGELSAEVLIDDGAIVIAAPDADGFLKQVLPNDGIRAAFQFGIGWSNKRGLYFRGGGGLEATLPLKQSLGGVLSLDSVYISLRGDEHDGLRAAAAATTTIELGPVTANVERFGLEALLTFPPDGGNLGVADLALRFKPPSGAALVIEAPGVKGGGYLFFDVDKQQYAGVLQLAVAEKIAVKAIGLLTTRMPDGSPGFSLLLIITAEGFSIQLGFGFTLTGIGGLLGVNRTAAADALRSAIRSGAVGSIMFPVDPVRNAQRIVSDVSTVFPVAPDRYVFGPMVQIAWGTPPIITLELGLVLEVPDPIRLIILGRGLILLPDAKAPVAQIRFDAVGIVDFAKGDVSFDATLYDSRLLAFVLTGDMALRAHFGDQPSFLFAVGGWHPRFPAPAGFPALSRIALTLSTTENARLRLEAYLAVTSNTVQFGARADFFFGLGDFGVEGYLGFDTLFHFAPTFSFIADLGASVALRSGTTVIMTVTLTMTLSGPQPWHVWGLATFTILGVKQAVAFDATYGAEPPQPALPAPVDVQQLLTAALADPRNWSGELPAGEAPRVAFRSASTTDRLRVHPLADVAVRERVAPLDMKLETFGTAPIAGATQLSVTAVRRGTSTAIPSQPIVDAFALAQFVHMSDDQKLAAPAFVDKPAGLRFSSSGFAFAAEPALDAAVTYETAVIVSGPSAAQAGPAYTMPAASLDNTARLRVTPH